MPWVPQTLYTILGEAPPARINLEALAVDRDLVGTEQSPPIENDLDAAP
jgi:hypothetical protein